MSSFIEFIFWVITLIATWYVLTFNIFPTAPSWTLPVIGIVLGSLLTGIRYVGTLKEGNMESRILLAVEKSSSRLESLILQSEQRVCDKLGGKIDNLSDRVARLEGREEARKETQKV